MTEPIPYTTTRYLCPFCRRGRSSKRGAVDHMARCWHNPVVRACKTCQNWWHDDDGGRDACGRDACAVGVDLTRNSCPACRGEPGPECEQCGGTGKGPYDATALVTGCQLWEGRLS